MTDSTVTFPRFPTIVASFLDMSLMNAATVCANKGGMDVLVRPTVLFALRTFFIKADGMIVRGALVIQPAQSETSQFERVGINQE